MPALPVLAPGVFFEETIRIPEPVFTTGVPAFIDARTGPIGSDEQTAWDRLQGGSPSPSRILRVDAALWSVIEADERLVSLSSKSYLRFAVRGFFENGGRQCLLIAPKQRQLPGLQASLDELEAASGFDLICAPDLARTPPDKLAAAQAKILQLCAARGDCFAILDALRCQGISPDNEIDEAKQSRASLASAAGTADGAMYLPWVKVRGACSACDGSGCIPCGGTGAGFVPPSGHVAGVFARTDERVGFHKAPANEAIEGAFDLELRLGPAAHKALNDAGINALRAYPGRGIRVAGAKTLSSEPEWAYINMRRVMLTVRRWLEERMAAVAFEPNDLVLWIRIRREVSGFLGRLFHQGAFRGRTPEQAFFVQCDAENNPPAVRDAGKVVTDIGLALQAPSEFVVARIVYGAREVTASSPFRINL